VMGQQPDIRTDGLGMDRYEQAPSRGARPQPATAPA
jgi:D-amino-acid dehydrogenase